MKTLSKLQNLSPPRRYIKLSSYFHRSRNGRISILNDELVLIRQLTNSKRPKPTFYDNFIL